MKERRRERMEEVESKIHEEESEGRRKEEGEVEQEVKRF